jgi:uncharacterized OsmC-like protein
MRRSATAVKSLKLYHLTGTGVGSKTVMKKNGLPDIVMDVPTAMGGKGLGPEPVELLLASLCGCKEVTALFVGRNMKPPVVIEKIEFDIHAERDQLGVLSLPLTKKHELPPTRLNRIWGTALVYTSSTQDEISFLAGEVKKRCPVANMVELSGCELDISFKKA